MNLFTIQRAKDDIAVSRINLLHKLSDIRIDIHIPCMNIDVHTFSTQIVTRHEHATVKLRHTTAITINIVKREHHTYTNCLPSIRLTNRGKRSAHGSVGCGSCLPRSKRNEHIAALLQ